MRRGKDLSKADQADRGRQVPTTGPVTTRPRPATNWSAPPVPRACPSRSVQGHVGRWYWCPNCDGLEV